MQAFIAGLAVFCLTAAVIIIGVPSLEERIAAEIEARLTTRSVHVHPGELLDLANNDDDDLHVLMLDVRSEADYENFHIADARHVSTTGIVDTVMDINLIKYFAGKTAIVVMSNDETAATEAWRTLITEDSLHVYILDGGVNNWLNVFADEELREAFAVTDRGDDEPGYIFDSTLMAEENPAANPDPDEFDISYETKVVIGTGEETEAAPEADTGGCG